MNAVGIDVSKGKSMVAALRPMGEVALLPREFLHTEVGLEQMAYAITTLGEDTRVIIEATGRYHEPVAAALHKYGIYVCVLNPLYIKQSGGGSIRKVKTDKADAMKIANYHCGAAASGGQDDAGRTPGRDDKACHATPRVQYCARHVRCWRNHCRAAYG